jgi:hypothetical protein
MSVVGLATVALAQEVPAPGVVNTNDFRGRVEGSFEWEPIDDLSFEAGLQLRLNNDLGTVDCFHTSFGAEYEACKNFSIGADYILINGYESDKRAWDKPRHRLNVNLTGSVKLGRVELSLRERVQTTFRTDSVNLYEKPKNEVILRSRLMTEYSIRHTRWTPYVLFELHNTLNAPKVVMNYKSDPFAYDNYITRYRVGVGTKLRATRNHRLDFYYYFDYDRGYDIDYKGNKGDLKGYIQENEFRHTFGISYKFKL